MLTLACHFLLPQTLNTGSLAWSACTALAYWYMVASWGGYSFIINLIPIHCLACIFTGRLSTRLYVAYAPFIVMGTLEAGALRSLLHRCLCLNCQEEFGCVNSMVSITR